MSRGPTRGRRVAATRRARVDPATVLAALLVLVAAAALALTRGAAPTAPAAAQSTGAPITRTVLACPSLRAGRAAKELVLAGALPTSGLAGTGTVRQQPSDTPIALSRGPLVRLHPSAGPRIDAHGALAAGLFAVQEDSAPGTLAVVGCAAPRARWWFTGAGATLDHASTLLLTNADPGPAVVDLHVLGLHGEVHTVGTRGITIAPGASTVVPLATIAPQQGEISVGVEASRGRVVAAVRDRYAATPGGAEGVDWLPDTAVPSRVQRLAGIPATRARHTLLVTNPGTLEAVVSLRLVGRHGTFVPTGLDHVTVAPRSVASVPLPTGAANGQAVAVRLRSQRPVLATVRSASAHDHSYAGPVPVLTGPVVAPVLPGTVLQLSTGHLPARVQVAAYDASGTRLRGTAVGVPARTTRSWSPPKAAAYLVLTQAPHSTGAVFGATTYSKRGLAAYPLRSIAVRERRPAMTPADR